MGAERYIAKVSVFNRVSSEADVNARLDNYKIYVGNNPDITKNAKCPGIFTGT